MHQSMSGLQGHVRHSDKVKYRKMLRVGSGDSGHSAQFADSVCGAYCAKTFNSPRTGSCGGGVEFVAAANPLHLRVETNSIVHGKCEISGHTKNIRDATRMQPGKHVLDYGAAHRSSCLSRSTSSPVGSSSNVDVKSAECCAPTGAGR